MRWWFLAAAALVAGCGSGEAANGPTPSQRPEPQAGLLYEDCKEAVQSRLQRPSAEWPPLQGVEVVRLSPTEVAIGGEVRVRGGSVRFDCTLAADGPDLSVRVRLAPP